MRISLAQPKQGPQLREKHFARRPNVPRTQILSSHLAGGRRRVAVGRSGKLNVGCARRESLLLQSARQIPPWRVCFVRVPSTPRQQPLEKSATNWRTQVKEIEEVNEAGSCALSLPSAWRAFPQQTKSEQTSQQTHHAKPPLIRNPVFAQPTQPPNIHLPVV